MTPEKKIKEYIHHDTNYTNGREKREISVQCGHDKQLTTKKGGPGGRSSNEDSFLATN